VKQKMETPKDTKNKMTITYLMDWSKNVVTPPTGFEVQNSRKKEAMQHFKIA